MKRFSTVAIAAVFLGALAMPAPATELDEDDDSVLEDAGETMKGAAESTGEAVKSGAKATGNAIKSGAEAVGEGVKKAAVATGNVLGITDSQELARYEANEKGEHLMHGTVSDLDRDNGIVNVRTDHGALRLYFPPDSLAQVNAGEQVTVQLAFVETKNLEKETAYDAPKVERDKGKPSMHVEHWVKGTVTTVNHETGMVDLQTGESTLTLHFPPESISNLNDGEEIAVQLAFAPKK